VYARRVRAAAGEHDVVDIKNVDLGSDRRACGAVQPAAHFRKSVAAKSVERFDRLGAAATGHTRA
jgi:hypothetical protein